MPETTPCFYWDSCVFLSYIEETPNRLPDIDGLLENAEKGKIEIITSTITIVEVAYAKTEREEGLLDPNVERKIEKLWIPPSPIRLVEFHKVIADKAKELIRRSLSLGLSLKPMDAIHLATAQDMNANGFHTYDDKLTRFEQLVNFKIDRPLITQLPLLPS
jgi:predicted nucleic acid-binding protein